MSVSSDTIPVNLFHPWRTQPTSIATLLVRAAQQNARSGIHLVSAQRPAESAHLSYAALFLDARCMLSALRSLRPPGSNVALLAEHPRDMIPAFWACILGGYIPCPLAPIRNDPERWARHLTHVCRLLDEPLIVATTELRQSLPPNVNAVNLDSLRGARLAETIHQAKASDPAILMLTSGSTGNSKAVVLTHANLLSSMAGKAARQKMTSADVTLNWIAFDHVAALLEIHMVSQYVAATQVHAEPASVLADPLLFLRLIANHRVTLAFAPNFLLGQINSILRSAPRDSQPLPRELDLSCLRYLVTGGEANVVETGRQFLELLEPHGLSGNVLRPAFGMTETSAASVYSHEFPDGDAGREFASVGFPVNSFRMRVVDKDGATAPAGEPGELEVRGPMVFRRYYNDAEATRNAFTKDGWFRTGDLARLESGRLCLVGRSKDSIIVSGVNYFSHELEAALEPLEGIERSFVAAFPTRPRGADTEQLVLAFATTFPLEEDARLYQLLNAIRSTTVLLWGFRPAVLLPLPKSAFPKTSLGKIQRTLLRKRFEAGAFADAQALVARAVRQQHGDHVPPATDTERTIAGIFAEIFDLDPLEVSATTNFFDLGGTSLDIIRLGQKLEKHLGLTGVPLVRILQNPSVRALARADGGDYDPIVPLQLSGSKTPLFCVHPGVGEVLVYMGLASYFVNDRPFYALRARAAHERGGYFTSFPEMVSAYTAAIRSRQPHGPYAIAGYSFGAPVAFEIAKRLESQGERVAFLGCIDETPFLAEPALKLEGPDGPLHVAFLLGLIDRKQLEELPGQLRGPLAAEDPCDYIVEHAPRGRLRELDLDLPKFRTWAELSRSLVVLGQSYVPSGMVASMTVFHADPLHGTATEWAEDVKRWSSFVRTPVRYINVPGEHHTLMNNQHVAGFQSVLRAEIERALGGQ